MNTWPKLSDLDGPACLENMIDCSTNGLQDVLDVLSVICDSKAEHLAHSWQDYNGKKRWHEVARQLDRLSNELKLKGLGVT